MVLWACPICLLLLFLLVPRWWICFPSVLFFFIQGRELFTDTLYSSVVNQYNVLKSAIFRDCGADASNTAISLSQPWLWMSNSIVKLPFYFFRRSDGGAIVQFCWEKFLNFKLWHHCTLLIMEVPVTVLQILSRVIGGSAHMDPSASQSI